MHPNMAPSVDGACKHSVTGSLRFRFGSGTGAYRSDPPSGLGPVAVPELTFADLAVGVAGELLDDLHGLRALVVRELGPAELDELRLGDRGARLDDGLHLLPPLRLWD